jgi:hypothetical protein
MFPAFAALIFLASPAQSVVFPDSPENHWVYVTVADLRSTGWWVGDFGFMGYHGRALTRREIAGAIGPTCVNLHEIVVGLRKANVDIAVSEGTYRAELAKRLAEDLSPTVREELKRIAIELPQLIDEFAPEVRNDLLEPRQLKGQLRRDISLLTSMLIATPGEALRQFPDVPTNHWAASAIQELRAANILHGYPTGKFHP